MIWERERKGERGMRGEKITRVERIKIGMREAKEKLQKAVKKRGLEDTMNNVAEKRKDEDKMREIKGINGKQRKKEQKRNKYEIKVITKRGNFTFKKIYIY